MRRRLSQAGVAVAVLLAFAASAVAATSFTDPTGDAGTAPDVGGVQVANDNAGNITFTLTIANRTTLDADDAVLLVLDSDRNPDTGNEGSDYAVVVMDSASVFMKWDGTDFAEFSHGPMTAGMTGGRATVTVNKADLGNTTALDFGAVTFDGDTDEASLDVAPDDGWWTYTLTTAPTTPPAAELDSVSALFTPVPARAGRVFSVGRVTGKLTDGRKVRLTSYACKAKVAGRALRPGAKCSWRLPRAAKGKRLAITLTVRYGGESGAVDPFTFMVR
jgi:hypothetical protein